MNQSVSPKKVAVVSGAFGYVGQAVATELAGNGFTLALLYKETTPEAVSTFMDTLAGAGHQAYACDLCDNLAVDQVIATIKNELGAIDLAVHTAGQKPSRKKLLQTSSDELKTQFEHTTLTSFNFLTVCGRVFKEQRTGVLIGLTTIGVIVSEATKSLGAYIPAKYAVQGILTMLREELAPAGVNVYAIAPGFMPGGMNADIPAAFVEMIQAKAKDQTLASAHTIATTVQALASKTLQPEGLTVTLAPEYNL